MKTFTTCLPFVSYWNSLEQEKGRLLEGIFDRHRYVPAQPKRMKDWLSIPKSNGYESLHITVLGPKQRWVEVQIRTRRMDEIAERGLAAHWKYKGIKSENGLDDWMNNVREVLEAAGNGGALELMRDFKMDLYKTKRYSYSLRKETYTNCLWEPRYWTSHSLIHTG